MKAIKKIGFHFVLIGVIILIYLFVFRPLRASLNSSIYYALSEEINTKENIKPILRNTQIWVYSYQLNDKIIYTFKLPFGFFYLLAIIGLLLFSANKKYYYVLTLLHLGYTLLIIITFMLGAISMNFWFLLMDFFSRYLLPLSSLGLVAYQLADKKIRSTNADQS